MSTDSRALEESVPIDYEAFQARPEFQEYRHRFRRFVFPLAVAFMVWFLLYVMLAAFAHDFMAQPFLGLNVGLWAGLAQFVTTFAITMWYVSFANRRLDPATTELRAELERIADGSVETGGGAR
ncbi:DUF485 domain-containing protein [Leucobacter sp.]